MEFVNDIRMPDAYDSNPNHVNKTFDNDSQARTAFQTTQTHSTETMSSVKANDSNKESSSVNHQSDFMRIDKKDKAQDRIFHDKDPVRINQNQMTVGGMFRPSGLLGKAESLEGERRFGRLAIADGQNESNMVDIQTPVQLLTLGFVHENIYPEHARADKTTKYTRNKFGFLPRKESTPLGHDALLKESTNTVVDTKANSKPMPSKYETPKQFLKGLNGMIGVGGINNERSIKSVLGYGSINEPTKTDKTLPTTFSLLTNFNEKNHKKADTGSVSGNNRGIEISNGRVPMFGSFFSPLNSNQHQGPFFEKPKESSQYTIDNNGTTAHLFKNTLNDAIFTNPSSTSSERNDNSHNTNGIFSSVIRNEHKGANNNHQLTTGISVNSLTAPSSLLSTPQSDVSNVVLDNQSQANDQIIQKANSMTSYGHETAVVNNNVGNGSYVQTLANLIDSISLTELTDLINTVSSSNKIGSDSVYATPNINGPYQMQVKQFNSVDVTHSMNMTHANLQMPILAASGNTNGTIRAASKDKTQLHVQSEHNVWNKKQPTQSDIKIQPKLKIGNTKVDSVYSSTLSKPNSNTGKKQGKVVVAPYLSNFSLGVVIESQQGSHVIPSGTSGSKAGGNKGTVSTAQSDTNALLDDLLSGLTLLLNTDSLTTTTPPAITTIAHVCDHSSPSFKCRGKGMFTSVDTMITWCLDQCKSTTGCVNTVCQCGCEKTKPAVHQKKKTIKALRKQKKLTSPTKKATVVRKPPQGRGHGHGQQKKKHGKQLFRQGKHGVRRGRQGIQRGNRRLLSNHEKQKHWHKPKPTTEEPPEIEWDDIVTTTTPIPPSTTEYVYSELGSTISPFDDIKLQLVQEQDVRAERIHVKKIPQVNWASETRSRLAQLAKNTARMNEIKIWPDSPITTTYEPYTSTQWAYTLPITTTFPPQRPRAWPTVRPLDTWTTQGWRRDRPADRWRGRTEAPRGAWRDSWSPPTTPPGSWPEPRPRYNTRPRPTYRSHKEAGHWGNNDRSRSGYGSHPADYRHDRSWNGPNHGLRNSWGNRHNNGGNQEPTEAPDK